VILAGDITEFGSDEEIYLAHSLLDSLKKPWYILSATTIPNGPKADATPSWKLSNTNNSPY
jgi:hypothetical protein